MRFRLALASAVAGVILAFTAPSFAASPSSAKVGPSSPSAGWTGKSFTAAATPGPDACPPNVDANNVLCDHFFMTVAVDGGYWKTHSGSVTVAISWGSSSNNFDLYLYSSSGKQLAGSARSQSKTEAVTLKNPAGNFEVRVVPKLVTSSGYKGSVAFSAKALPPPPPPPPPPPSPPPSPPPGHNPGGGPGGGGGSGYPFPNGGSGGSYYYGGYDPGQSYGPGSGGSYYGGSTSFEPAVTTTTSRHVYYQTEGGTDTGKRVSRAAGANAARPVSPLVWIILPLGLLLLVASGYAVFEKEAAATAIVQTSEANETGGSSVPVMALTGLFVKTAAGAGKALAAAGRAIGRTGGRLFRLRRGP